jgi:hypothetical protein
LSTRRGWMAFGSEYVYGKLAWRSELQPKAHLYSVTGFVYSRSLGDFDFTSTGVDSFSFTFLKSSGMFAKVTLDHNGWNPGLNGCLVVMIRQYLLCRTHCATKQWTGSGTRRTEWSLRVSEVGPVCVSISVQNENFVSTPDKLMLTVTMATARKETKIDSLTRL